MFDWLALCQRSFCLVNTLWLPAMVLYFIEHAAFTGSLGIPFVYSRFLDLALGAFFKIIFLCWVWGVILETGSGESSISRLPSFVKHLRVGWWVALTFLIVPWVVHFLFYIFCGQMAPDLGSIQLSIAGIVAGWGVITFAARHYRLYIDVKGRRPASTMPLFIAVVIFTGMNLAVLMFRQVLGSWPLAVTALDLLEIQLRFFSFAIFAEIFLAANPAISRNFYSARTLILVNPLAGSIRTEAFSTIILRRYPPFFAVLRALTPPNYRVIEYNRVIFRDHFFRKDALVAISCVTANSAAAYQMARVFRSRGAKVVMGGPHVSFFPGEALEYCDSVVVGAAESVWGKIISDYEHGALKQLYVGECTKAENGRVLNFLLASPSGIIRDTLQISPGCKFNCYFCATTALTGKARPKRAVSEIVDLLKHAGRSHQPVVFIDNNIYEDPVFSKELFKAMVPLKQSWAASASIDIARDDEMVRLLKRSGCVQLLIGYEIDDGASESSQEGKLAMAKDYLVLTKKLQKAGILIQAQFIFGFPGDSWASLFRLWRFCWRLSPLYAWVSFLTPLPGARYFKESVDAGRMVNLNWRAYDLMRQVAETEQLKRTWILQYLFTAISLGIFFTTSFAGRFMLLMFCVLQFLYWNVAQ